MGIILFDLLCCDGDSIQRKSSEAKCNFPFNITNLLTIKCKLCHFRFALLCFITMILLELLMCGCKFSHQGAVHFL